MPVSWEAYQAKGPSVVALGTFDGVHLGHQALLGRAAAHALAHQAISLAFVFSRPPANYLGQPKPLLLPPEIKYRKIERFVACAVCAEFPQMASMQPQDFVHTVLCAKLHAKGLVVGTDYGFGKDRAGDVGLLRSLGQRHGFFVDEVEPVQIDGQAVSSTRVRRAIREGRIGDAAQLLGYFPLLCGQVIQGEGRGQKLGYPTANLECSDDFISPEQGIFAAVACLKQRAYPAAVYVGTKPTFSGRAKSVEVHLLGEDVPSLYGRTLCVQLTAKVRDDQAFASAAELKTQIQADVDAVRRLITQPLPETLCLDL